MTLINVKDAPPIVTDDEEVVEHTERDLWHSEENHRGRGFPVVAKVSQRPFHPTGDRPLRDIKAEQGKFAMDARCSSVGFSTTIRTIDSRSSFGVVSFQPGSGN
jgi:hypothetical protein